MDQHIPKAESLDYSIVPNRPALHCPLDTGQGRHDSCLPCGRIQGTALEVASPFGLEPLLGMCPPFTPKASLQGSERPHKCAMGRQGQPILRQVQAGRLGLFWLLKTTPAHEGHLGVSTSPRRLQVGT